jgi:hypothetical protein
MPQPLVSCPAWWPGSISTGSIVRCYSAGRGSRLPAAARDDDIDAGEAARPPTRAMCSQAEARRLA